MTLTELENQSKTNKNFFEEKKTNKNFFEDRSNSELDNKLENGSDKPVGDQSKTQSTKILCILDGFGLSPDSPNNCISRAKMPNIRRLLNENFWTVLNADGEKVGQEAGLVGNSEVGHMNIGGLKLVPQLSYQITKSSGKRFLINPEIAPDQIFDPTKFFKNEVRKNILGYLKSTPQDGQKPKIKTRAAVHLIGLFSTGTIHSDLRHWVGAVQSALEGGMAKIILHLMSDGRDSDKKSLVETWHKFVLELTQSVQDSELDQKIPDWSKKIFLGSLGGRFYGMDRDKNWERVDQHLEAIFGCGEISKEFLDGSYLEESVGSKADEIKTGETSEENRSKADDGLKYYFDRIKKDASNEIEKYMTNSLTSNWQSKNKKYSKIDLINLNFVQSHFIDKYGEATGEDLSTNPIFSIAHSNIKYPYSRWLTDFYAPHDQGGVSFDFIDLTTEMVKKHTQTRDLNYLGEIIQKIADFNYQSGKFDEHINPISLNLAWKDVYEVGPNSFDSHKINSQADSATDSQTNSEKSEDQTDKNSNLRIEKPEDTYLGILPGDNLWLINFRTDRMKQFAQALVDVNNNFRMDLQILAMNDYGDGNAVHISEKDFKYVTSQVFANQLFDPIEFIKNNWADKNGEGKSCNKTVHLVGLFSPKSVHSSMHHWAQAMEASDKAGAKKIILHIISDGVESEKNSLVDIWDGFVEDFGDRLKPFENKIFLGSLGGRFYAMDSGKNWERVYQSMEMVFSPVTGNGRGRLCLLYNEPLHRLFLKKYEEFHKDDDFDVKSWKNWFSPWMQDFYKSHKIKNNNSWQDTYNTLSNGYKLEFSSVDEMLAEHIPAMDNLDGLIGLDMIKAQLISISDYNYKKGFFDDKIVPTTTVYFADSYPNISFGDTIWLLNSKADSMKQFAQVLCDIDRKVEMNLQILAMNDYGDGNALEYPNFDDKYKDVAYKNGYNPVLKEKPQEIGSEAHIKNAAESIDKASESKEKIQAERVVESSDEIIFEETENEGTVVKKGKHTMVFLDDIKPELVETSKLGYYPIFSSKPVENTLAQTISQKLNKTQLHIAETEKYNHVTFFLNGGQDKKWEGEDWIVIPSNKIPSHADKPEMKAGEVTDQLVQVLDNKEGLKYDYIIVNYANPDMVGHTGDIKAGIRSMEFLDDQLGKLIQVIEKNGHEMIVIADHGNMEFVGEYTENGQTLTDSEHNSNPVPCIFVGRDWKLDGGSFLDRKNKFLEKIDELSTSQVIQSKLDKNKLNTAFQNNTDSHETENTDMPKIMADNQNDTANSLDSYKDYQKSSSSSQSKSENTQDWLNSQQILEAAKADLPLWYSGVLLLGLAD